MQLLVTLKKNDLSKHGTKIEGFWAGIFFCEREVTRVTLCSGDECEILSDRLVSKIATSCILLVIAYRKRQQTWHKHQQPCSISKPTLTPSHKAKSGTKLIWKRCFTFSCDKLTDELNCWASKVMRLLGLKPQSFQESIRIHSRLPTSSR